MQYAVRFDAAEESRQLWKAIDEIDDTSSAGGYEGRRCSIRSAPRAVHGIEFDIPNPWNGESLREVSVNIRIAWYQADQSNRQRIVWHISRSNAHRCCKHFAWAPGKAPDRPMPAKAVEHQQLQASNQ